MHHSQCFIYGPTATASAPHRGVSNDYTMNSVQAADFAKIHFNLPIEVDKMKQSDQDIAKIQNPMDNIQNLKTKTKKTAS